MEEKKAVALCCEFYFRFVSQFVIFVLLEYQEQSLQMWLIKMM